MILTQYADVNMTTKHTFFLRTCLQHLTKNVKFKRKVETYNALIDMTSDKIASTYRLPDGIHTSAYQLRKSTVNTNNSKQYFKCTVAL